MCGRYTLSKLEQLLRQFPAIIPLPPGLMPRFNIAPTQPVPVIANNHPDRVELFQWGLIPSWSKDSSCSGRMINARAETLAERPSFRTALKRRRCLVPADGFYEWRKEPDGKTKTPMYVRRRDGEPFAFAGLWDVWHTPDGSVVPSCTVITTAPNELMAPIHDRMPAILPRSAYERWLSPREQDAVDMTALLQPYPAAELEAYPVSRMVNSPRNEGAELMNRVDAEAGEAMLF
jgi:putative SOS response-associated peptidase YedK